MLDVRRLQLLYEFAARGSIASTASAVSMTASAVSQQLAALEKEAGMALLERTARSAHLTDAGRRLVEHAGTILDAIEAAEADLAALDDDPRGRVTVTAFPTAAVALAAPVVRRLRKHRDLTMVLRQQRTAASSIKQVRSGDIDLALVDDWSGVARSGPQGPLTFHHLGYDPLVVVLPARHREAGEDRLSASQLMGEPWIASPEGEPSRTALERLWRAEGVSAPSVSEFEGLGTILTLVGKGLGVTVAPRMATVSHSGVAVRNLSTPVSGRDIYAVHRTASTQRPAVMAVLQVLHSSAKRLGSASEA
ncbi:LysR family transcriptional regulator [Natronoglycomyces albus]|uniref:LysR family transcriptional regulator n=1 Tax=Natronoglycomyces albus TaxID=2811108 RepID=A0A895XKJ3_9ACTN|nr:LysR family transcriptional regulator [Natronoglycomyces albus]QSB04332.1 LysR family transcriptional regulator [Natronoglycomyces albus]